jgi:glutamyl-tRNA synthetase
MSDRPSVVTRFAPSPTGSLHIGGARTALFNWLYARHTGGKFLLRVEDTDRERSTPQSVQVIFEGLTWLGVTPDAPPVFQFARAERHREVVAALVAQGAAFRCYMTPEEADEAKLVARAEGHALRSPWRDRDPAEWQGVFVIRFKTPTEGDTVIEDVVRGPVRFPNKDLEDIVLLRSDGTPTYNVAVTIDDHDMGVTHIIRGEEHLSNAGRQTLIYQAMGWPVPAFAHIPLIHGPDGQKLSKRHGAQAVGEFADMGYLPEAMRNYLARLGWGHGDDELFTDDQAIAWFDVADVVKAPARLDWAKLNHINNHYIRVADDQRLAMLTVEAHARSGGPMPPDVLARLKAAIPVVKDGAKTVVELAELTVFALKTRPLVLDDRTQGLLTDETRGRMQRLVDQLIGAKTWTAAALLDELKDFAAAEGVGMGKFGPALRGILGGGSPAPDLAGALAALGRDESLGRVQDALSKASQTI